MSNEPLDYKDLGFTDTAMKVLKERYLHKDPVTGEQETIIGMFNRVSKTVAQGDRKKQADYMAVMLDRYFLPNSPTLMNAGRSGRHGQLSACYVLPVEDSMDGIFSALKNQALIHKFGGGTGFNFSHLRPKGAAVNSTGGVATGPVSFMELFDMATEKVQQGGCFPAGTLVATADGPVPIEQIQEGTLVYSHDDEKGMVLTPCSAAFKTREDAELWELKTDKGFSVEATGDHPFKLRTGGRYVKLSELRPNMPLLPLTIYTKKDGYPMLSLQDGKDTRLYVHRWVAAQLGHTHNTVHHINHNPGDFRLSNLLFTNNHDHAVYHNNVALASGSHPFQHLTDEQRRKGAEAYSQYWAALSEEQRALLRKKDSDALVIENAKRFANGTHNFIGDRHPSKDPEIRIKQKKGRILNCIWNVLSKGIVPTAKTWTTDVKRAGLDNLHRFKLETILALFGSFDNAMTAASSRNHRVLTVTNTHKKADVFDIEVPGTHNFVVCNADGTVGLVVHNCRRGANMGILNVDHPDILDFITSKLSGDKLTNFNISVGMTDEFMQKVVDDALDEREKEIWSTIIMSAWRSGDPGLVFLGTINKKNKHPELGELEATNPCAECPLHDFEACNLGSINLSRFVTSTNTGVNDKLPIHLIDWDKLRRVVNIAVDFLNDVIDVNCYPLPEIAEAVQRSRKIGLGVMGWADMLNKLGVRYGSDESLFLAQQVMCFIHEEGHRASRGRNRCVTCIAPTGTISLIAGCSSGIEPLFALEYDRIAFAKDENADGSSRKQVLHYVDPEYLAARNNPEDQRIELGVFVTAQELSYQKHIKMQAAFQEYTDLAVSKTINLPNKATLEDIDKAYRMAWLSDCCGITVYRDGCKNVQVLYKTADDESQAEVCPECGSASVVRESGCKRCTQCGWSPCSV